MSDVAVTEIPSELFRLQNGAPDIKPQSRNRFYDALARRIHSAFSGPHNGVPRALGFTSSQTGEGVTTVAANTAISAARMMAGRVLLVDTNFADPRQHNIFGADPAPGLLDALLSDQSALDGIIDTPLDNLSLLPAGRIDSSQPVTYDPRCLDELVVSLRRVYSLIVFDLPPVSRSSPTLAFAGWMDGMLLVVEADRMPRDVVRRTCIQLATVQANLLGVVYNKVRTSGRL